MTAKATAERMKVTADRMDRITADGQDDGDGKVSGDCSHSIGGRRPFCAWSRSTAVTAVTRARALPCGNVSFRYGSELPVPQVETGGTGGGLRHPEGRGS